MVLKNILIQLEGSFYLWIVNRTLLLLGSGPLYSYYYNLSIWTKYEQNKKKIWLPISDLSKSYSNRNTTPKVILAYFFYNNNILITLYFSISFIFSIKSGSYFFFKLFPAIKCGVVTRGPYFNWMQASRYKPKTEAI